MEQTNCKIWIYRTVLDFIFSNGNEHLPNETGGVLIGYRADDHKFVITDVVGPGPKAVHNPSSFYPDNKFHKKEIAEKYKLSGYTETYLGDWHTHPNAAPYLSDKDKQTIRKISRHRTARLANPIMLVAAPPKDYYKVWVYDIIESRQEIYREAEILILTSNKHGKNWSI